jgi:hypothetical protein
MGDVWLYHATLVLVRGWKVGTETIGNKHISVPSRHAFERSAPLRGQAPAECDTSASHTTKLTTICITELKKYFV